MDNEEFDKILHDINNILCSLSGYTEMLIDIEKRTYQKRLLSHMNLSIEKLKDIVRDFYKYINKEET